MTAAPRWTRHGSETAVRILLFLGLLYGLGYFLWQAL